MFHKTNYALLESKLSQEPCLDYPHLSRVHPLRSFGPSFFVKRDDELGFGISGSKYRKYRTLIPYLKQYQEVIVLGGAFSNHVLGITQLLLENGITPTLFLKGSKPKQSLGNFFFLKSLLPETSFHWIPNNEWKNIQSIASDYAASCENAYILPEGGAIFPSFLGALTLPLDIIRNESQLNTHFDHIFLDVGTGLSAAALALGFAFLQKQSQCHFLCIAGTEQEFCTTLQNLHPLFEMWLQTSFSFSKNFTCYFPTTAKSFGSTNSTVFQFINSMANKEGFFLDPIYSGKLFYHANFMKEKFQGNTLIIHSGGALSLSGFQVIEKVISSNPNITDIKRKKY